jgi:hypothetical protein
VEGIKDLISGGDGVYLGLVINHSMETPLIKVVKRLEPEIILQAEMQVAREPVQRLVAEALLARHVKDPLPLLEPTRNLVGRVLAGRAGGNDLQEEVDPNLLIMRLSRGERDGARLGTMFKALSWGDHFASWAAVSETDEDTKLGTGKAHQWYDVAGLAASGELTGAGQLDGAVADLVLKQVSGVLKPRLPRVVEVLRYVSSRLSTVSTGLS